METAILIADFIFKICVIICLIGSGIYLLTSFIKWIVSKFRKNEDLTKKYDSGYLDIFLVLSKARDNKDSEDWTLESKYLQATKELIEKRLKEVS